MKKIINKHPNLVYLFFFIILVIFHLTLKTNVYDDVYFKTFKISELDSFLTMRYNMWSSRVFIDAAMVIFLNLPKILWCIVDSLALTIIAWSISYIFSNNLLKNKLLSIGIVLIYPFIQMGEAGWYATTINYLWPMACMLIAMLPIKNIIIEKQEKKWMYPIYIIAAIFACNQEQSCALMLGFLVLFNFYFIFIKKQKKILPILLLGIAIASIIFILTCPGNKIRVLEETKKWFPTFENFTIIHKLFLGFNSGLAIMIFKQNIIFFLFSTILAYLGIKEEKIFKKICFFFPLLIILGINVFINYFGGLGTKLAGITQTFSSFAAHMPYVSISSKKNIMILLLTLITISSIIYALYNIYQKEPIEKRLFVLILFIAGFLSVVILGFTPTIYASGERTYAFLNYIMLMIIFWITYSKKDKNINYICTFFVLLEIINTLILTNI